MASLFQTPDQAVVIKLLPRWLNRVHLGPDGAVPAAAPLTSIHHVTVTGTTEFHDYETFGSDEHAVIAFRQETMLGTNDTGITLLKWSQGFGGEERVEIDIVGSIREDGVLSVMVNARFFEGATEGTSELEEAGSWSGIVTNNAVANFQIHLKNDEDDWAIVRASVGNRRLQA